MHGHKRPFQNKTPRRALQDFLSAVCEPEEQGSRRQEKILASYAEVRFQLHGGGKCPLCRASVRHVIPVRAERSDGSVTEYACLCHRCFTAERAACVRVILSTGRIRLEFGPYSGSPARTQKFRASPWL